MAKILFVNPVVREDDPRHVPYGIALLSSICIERGHLVQVYDENARRKGPEIFKDHPLESILKKPFHVLDS